jgi:Ca-activated chloride channel homolog
MKKSTDFSGRNFLRNYFLVVLSVVFVFSLLILSIGKATGNGEKLLGKNIIKKPVEGIHNAGPIQLSMKLNNNRYYYDEKNNQVYLYLDLKADEIEVSDRTPMNLSIVVDRSGSMSSDNKLGYVKEAVNYIIDELNYDDYVSVVTYDDYVDVLQNSSQMESRYNLKEKVNGLQSGGYTNLSGGMLEGFDQVKETYKTGYVNRVLLLSDGIANRGITEIYKLKDIVKEKNYRDGIVLSTFGVGSDFNEDLMSTVADYGRGNYYFINDPDRIPRIFAEELRGIRALAGQNTKVKVRFPSEYFELNKVFGYPYETSGDEIEIDFKDVFASETKSVLLKFDVKRKPSRNMTFSAELEYDDVTNGYRKITDYISQTLDRTDNYSFYKEGFDQEIQQQVAMFEANEIMEEAMRLTDEKRYDEARGLLQTGRAKVTEELGDMAPSPEVSRQLENIDRYESDMSGVETKSEEEKSTMQKSAKYENYNIRKGKEEEEDE